jgi:transcriptional regulator with XRE-family HTH domain
MARRSRLKLPPIRLGDEPIGTRLSRLRKERGFSQIELARRIGIIQVLVSDYETGKLRLHAEMLARFARALGVSSDQILGLASGDLRLKSRNPRLLRRLVQVEDLPKADQRAVLQHIAALVKARAAGDRHGGNGAQQRA